MKEEFEWLEWLKQSGYRVYSQGGQDGIIAAIFERIGTTNKTCVEFGFNADTLDGGSGANTALLVLRDKWQHLFFDDEHDNPLIHLNKVRLTEANIGDEFGKRGVPISTDYVSIDVDGDDLYLMRGVLNAGFRPRLLSVEYNCNIQIGESLTVIEGTKWTGDSVYGASLRALYKLAVLFGYKLVAVEPGLDAFFVRGDLIYERLPLSFFEYATNIRLHPAASKERMGLLVQY